MACFLRTSNKCGARFSRSAFTKGLSKNVSNTTTFSTSTRTGSNAMIGSPRKLIASMSSFNAQATGAASNGLIASFSTFQSSPSKKRFISTSSMALPSPAEEIDDQYLQRIALPPSNDPSATVIRQIQSHIDNGAQDAFMVVDLGAVVEQQNQFRALLPRVRPFYAVKCNPDAEIVRVLAEMGCGFDCASKAEIDLALSMGVSPRDIIFANPCKQPTHIEWAKQCSVRTMTFDSVEELSKIKKLYPESHLVLRILVDDSCSTSQLGAKFGAAMEDVPDLLAQAKNLDLNLVGVSFHVGSGCYNVEAFGDAVHRSRRVFDMAKDYGFNLNLLDLGGGFPGNNENSAISFPDIAKNLSSALDVHFPEGCGVDIIAEPGRYYVARSHTLAVNIFGKKLKTMKNNEKNHMYYVNDGVYGSFNCVVNDHAKVKPNRIQREGNMIIATPLLENELAGKPTYNSSLWGPTCDGIDCFLKDIQLPKLEVGEWLYFSNMGAYTSAAGSQFNGFKLPEKHYINTAIEGNTATGAQPDILMMKGQNPHN